MEWKVGSDTNYNQCNGKLTLPIHRNIHRQQHLLTADIAIADSHLWCNTICLMYSINPLTASLTWWALHIKSRSCLLRNFDTTSAPNVKLTWRRKLQVYRLWTFIDNTDDNHSPLCHSLPNPAHPYRDLTTAGRTTTLEKMSLAISISIFCI